MITKEFDIEEAKAITAGETDGRLVSRDGFPARIIFWEAKGNFPIIALIDDGSDEHPYCYTMNGRSDTRDFVRTSHDLMIEYGDNGIINTRDEAIEALMKDYDEGANIRDVIETAMVFADTHPKGGETMSRSKKAVANRLAKLVEHQQKVCDLLGKLSDDAYELSIRIGINERRTSAAYFINEYLKDAVVDRNYYESLQKNILEEMGGGEQ